MRAPSKSSGISTMASRSPLGPGIVRGCGTGGLNTMLSTSHLSVSREIESITDAAAALFWPCYIYFPDSLTACLRHHDRTAPQLFGFDRVRKGVLRTQLRA